MLNGGGRVLNWTLFRQDFFRFNLDLWAIFLSMLMSGTFHRKELQGIPEFLEHFFVNIRYTNVANRCYYQ